MSTAEVLQRALDRLAAEDRLRCVVDGKTTNDGRPAPLCLEDEQMAQALSVRFLPAVEWRDGADYDGIER